MKLSDLKKIDDQIRKIKKAMVPFEKKLEPLLENLEQHVKLREEIVGQLELEVLEEQHQLKEQMGLAGAEYIFVNLENADDFRDCTEDDGTLHITIGKLHGCFICDQDLTRSEWNKLARPLVKQFGFKWSDL